MFRVELFRGVVNVEQTGENIGEASENIGEASENFGETSENFEEPMEKHIKCELNDTQKKIIKLLAEDNRLSASKLAKKIGVASRNIEVNIKKLREQGVIVRCGSPKTGYWEIADKQYIE